jgi:anti-anti-sigma regulatory factor
VAVVTHRRFARANGIDRVEFIILDLTPVPHMDSMGAHFLEELNEVRLCDVLFV